jgi:type I restriction enzyme M protein
MTKIKKSDKKEVKKSDKKSTKKSPTKKSVEQEDNSLEKSLWESAEQLRGTVEVSNYKYIALGLMFLKFISDRFEERKKEIEKSTKSDKERAILVEDKDSYLEKNIPFLDKGCRWDDLMKVASQRNIGLKIDQILRKIEQTNSMLSDVTPQVFTDSKIANENLTALINEFSKIGFGTKEALDTDTFGRAYEYFIGKFAMNEGRRGGQFYTPRSVVKLLVEILKPYKGIIFDPACGSGGMFVQSQKFLKAHEGKNSDISIYGQEVIDGIWRIAKMNLVLRGMDASNIHLGDSLKNDKFPENKKANFILANPPFNVSEWGYEMLSSDKRWDYGIPKKTNANYAWMQHMLYHLDDKNGRMGLVLANGSMSASGDEKDIRKKIVDADLIDCMVALPKGLFTTTKIEACIWFFTKNKSNGQYRKRNGETLFIDARKIFTPVTRALNKFSDKELEKIAGTYRSFIGEKEYPKYEDVAGYCKVITKDEIANKGYTLIPGRHVGVEEIADDSEPFPDKMKRLTTEYDRLTKESVEIDEEIRKNLKDIGFEI